MQSKQKSTRKVYTGTDRYIDKGTGEITDVISRHRHKVNEKLKFILFMDKRTIFKDLSGAEIKVFLLLALDAEMDTGMVRTTQMDKQKIADEMGITSTQTVADIITRLVDKEFLFKIERGIYRLNEDHAWRGSKESIVKRKNEGEA